MSEIQTAESEAQRVRDMTSGPVLHPLAEPKTMYLAPAALAVPLDSIALTVLTLLTFTLDGSGLLLLWLPAVHLLCIGLGKRDPHVGHILLSRLNLTLTLLMVPKQKSQIRIQRADGSWMRVKSRIFKTA